MTEGSAIRDDQPRALFDACVLYDAAVFRFFALAAQTGMYIARWTDRIVDEAIRNLVKDGRELALGSLHLSRQLLLDPIVAPPSSRALKRFSETDAKDRHVAATAAADHCNHLVTFNLRDFDPNKARDQGFVVLHPDQFGLVLLERNPAATIIGIDRSPPERLQLFLDRLDREMPETIAKIRPLFGGSQELRV